MLPPPRQASPPGFDSFVLSVSPGFAYPTVFFLLVMNLKNLCDACGEPSELADDAYDELATDDACDEPSMCHCL